MSKHPKFHHQVEAIENGTVIDHIPAATTLKIAQIIANPEDQIFVGVNFRSNSGVKGVLKIANRELSPTYVNRLALLAPGATINIIRDYDVVEKAQVEAPDSFQGIANCANPNCITNHEEWATCFHVVSKNPLTVHCQHCERNFPADELSII